MGMAAPNDSNREHSGRPDHGRPRIGAPMMQNSGPTGSSTRVFSHGRSSGPKAVDRSPLETIHPSSDTEVWALVGGLNPVVVRVATDRLGEGGCCAVVRACAKEGLIEQRAAQKTAARVRDELIAESRPRR
jgi:hypothetical protein